MDQDKQKKIQEFLLSNGGNLGNIINNGQEEYEQMTATAQEGPGQNKKGQTSEKYLQGAGDLDVPPEQQQDIAERLEERKQRSQLLKESAKNIFAGNKLSLVANASSLGKNLAKGLGRDKYAQIITLLLAGMSDILDNIDIIFLEATLGTIGMLTRTFIFFALLSISMRVESGGSIKRGLLKSKIGKRVIIYIVDMLLGFIIPFAPATFISYVLLIRSEIKLAKSEDRKQKEDIDKAEKNARKKSQPLRDSELEETTQT